MRVMHVMAGAKEGGAENIMLESVLALAEAGLEQHVVTRPDNAFRIKCFEDAGIQVTTTGFSNAWPFPTRTALNKAIEQFQPDVIEYWMGRAGQFAPAAHRARSLLALGGGRWTLWGPRARARGLGGARCDGPRGHGTRGA